MPAPAVDEQARAASTACSSGRLVLIHGAPGTGKATLLTPVVEAYRTVGCKVSAAAEAWRVCEGLGCDCGIPFAALTTISGRGSAELRIDDRTVLLVDEVALIGTERMVQLLRFGIMRGVKLIIAADPDQLRPIAAAQGTGSLRRQRLRHAEDEPSAGGLGGLIWSNPISRARARQRFDTAIG